MRQYIIGFFIVTAVLSANAAFADRDDKGGRGGDGGHGKHFAGNHGDKTFHQNNKHVNKSAHKVNLNNNNVNVTTNRETKSFNTFSRHPNDRPYYEHKSAKRVRANDVNVNANINKNVNINAHGRHHYYYDNGRYYYYDHHHHRVYDGWVPVYTAGLVTMAMINAHPHNYMTCYATVNGSVYRGYFQYGSPCYVNYPTTGTSLISINHYTIE